MAKGGIADSEDSVKHQSSLQGGDTPIYSVLRSSSSVKMKVKGQPPKIGDSQKEKCLLAGQESRSSDESITSHDFAHIRKSTTAPHIRIQCCL